MRYRLSPFSTRVRSGLGFRVVLVLLLGLLFGSAHAAAPPNVVVSIKPLHALLAGLLRGVAEPVLLVDGDITPWEFVPSDDQRRAMASADLVVWSGAELEPGLAALLAPPADDARVFEVLASDVLKVLPARADEQRRDPFYWLDSRNMLILLDTLARRLIEIDPARAPAYERNWQRIGEALAEIDRVMEYGYRDVSGVPVFFYHDNHQYFEQAYAMHVAGAVADPTATADDVRQLLATRQRIMEVGRACVFTERLLDEPHLDLLLAGTGIDPVELDSFGATLDPGETLYVDLMRGNFARISDCVRALKGDNATAGPAEPDMTRAPDRLSPRYAMLDQHGRMVSSEDFHGRLQLIYFGYTWCPDICPTSLAVMVQALHQLGDLAEQVQPIFITVDPERDTPELLAEYARYFHPRLLALSANPEVTRRTAELFRARYEFVPSESGDPRRYSVDHTASLYLLGRDGGFITKFAHGLPAHEVAERLRAHLEN